MTDHLGSNSQIIPTCTDITTEDLAVLFFNHWYCENRLPKDIISDWDKIFVLKFWCAPHKLTGVKLKLSSAYDPKTDGSSERSNKTINQCIHYHVCQNQERWVCALSRICFDIMNSVNSSTGFSHFQIHLGHSPHLIQPIVLTTVTNSQSNTTEALCIQDSVATVWTSVFANLSNKIAKITGNFENADEAKNWGVFCQH